MTISDEKKTKTRSIIRGNLIGVIDIDQIDKTIDNIVEDLERMLNNDIQSTEEPKSMDNAQKEA
jgi:cell division ATPase FtsA